MTPASLLTSRRKDFTGLNDKYAIQRVGARLGMRIDQAIAGKFPFDVNGSSVPDTQRDVITSKLNRYRMGQQFYRGDHFANPLQEGERKAVFNFCKTIVDKGVDWAIAKGWKVECSEGNEMVAELLNVIWKGNKQDHLSARAMQFGAVTGDSYYYVTVRTKDKYGRLLPRHKWTVRIQTLDPSNVFPIWSDNSEHEMKACLIQFPAASAGAGERLQLNSIFITEETYEVWVDDVLVMRDENPVGEVNVVHVPNFELSVSDYGQSDIESIIPINEEYNIVANAIRRIIKYHAEPTTVIYGMKASNLEKGANKVWSNLPPPNEARIENLVLESDLAANFKYLEGLKTLICELSNTPQIAFDSFEARLSNSSAAALELMFQPLLEKTARRQRTHSAGVAEINRLAILFQQIVIGTDLTELVDDMEAIEESHAVYTSPLPRDQAQELDLGIKRVNAKVWSQAELIRQMSHVKNLSRLSIELIADKSQELQETYQKQKALLGERPDSTVAFLGSMNISQDLEKLQEEIASLQELHKTLSSSKSEALGE